MNNGKPKHLPVVLTVEEIFLVLSQLSGVKQLMARLLYGSGLRLMECHRLRVKDIDMTAKQIMVCNGKGFKDRLTVLAETVIPLLEEHLIRVKALHKDFPGCGYSNCSGVAGAFKCCYNNGLHPCDEETRQGCIAEQQRSCDQALM